MDEDVKELFWHESGSEGGVTYLPMILAHLDEPVISEKKLLVKIGRIAGECYNSSKDEEACIRRALSCIQRGHHSPWEHHNVTLRCVVDRGTSHALVRHRHCAYQQSSTIYQKYTHGIQVIAQPVIDPMTGRNVEAFTEYEKHDLQQSTLAYMLNVNNGIAAGRARDILPTCLATTLIITTNIRELMYIAQRRQGPGDSERMHCFAWLLNRWLEEHWPKVTEAFNKWYMTHPI